MDPWDGKKRLKRILFEFFKIPIKKHHPLAEWMGKAIFLAIVERAFNPGEPFQHMPVLKGNQDCGKSTYLELLLPFDYMFGASLSLDGPYVEQVSKLIQKRLQEVPEMGGSDRADIRKVKALISPGKDHARLKYRADAEDYHRTCVMVGTLNEEQGIIDDLTGNRCFSVIEVGRKNIWGGFGAWKRKLIELRPKLFAEAYHLYQKGVTAGLPEKLKGLSEEVTKGYRAGDFIFEDAFQNFCEENDEFTMLEALQKLKKKRIVTDFGKKWQMRGANLAKKTHEKSEWTHGKHQRGWKRKKKEGKKEA